MVAFVRYDRVLARQGRLQVVTMQQWYVVRCKPREDERAEMQLGNQEYEVYRPLARMRRWRGNSVTHRIESLFPGYLFIHLDATQGDWSPIRSTRGVLDLVRFGTYPTPLPDEIIQDFHQREDKDHGWVDLTGASRYQRNQAIRIVDGPFAGHEALFQSHSGQDRVIVLLNIMQQSVRTTVPGGATTQA